MLKRVALPKLPEIILPKHWSVKRDSLLADCPGRGVRGYVIVATGPRHTNLYFFSEALFVLVTQDDGVSLHLRNAGTISACSSVGSFGFVRVSVVRLAPALYPIF
jgi:hypothetical protein